MSKDNQYMSRDIMHLLRLGLAICRGALVKFTLRAFPGSRVRIGKNLRCFGFPRFLYVSGKINISDSVTFGKATISVSPSAYLDIGKGSSFNDFTFIMSGKSITIGENVLIGEMVSIRDTDHSFKDVDVAIAHQEFVSQAIDIRDNVWVGRGSVILKGVCIGEGAVVGANSVVTCDIPPYSVSAGAPARVIRTRTAPASSDYRVP